MKQFLKRWIIKKAETMQKPSASDDRELILRQLFLLRQDTEFLKQLATKENNKE